MRASSETRRGARDRGARVSRPPPDGRSRRCVGRAPHARPRTAGHTPSPAADRLASVSVGPTTSRRARRVRPRGGFACCSKRATRTQSEAGDARTDPLSPIKPEEAADATELGVEASFAEEEADATIRLEPRRSEEEGPTRDAAEDTWETSISSEARLGAHVDRAPLAKERGSARTSTSSSTSSTKTSSLARASSLRGRDSGTSLKLGGGAPSPPPPRHRGGGRQYDDSANTRPTSPRATATCARASSPTDVGSRVVRLGEDEKIRRGSVAASAKRT